MTQHNFQDMNIKELRAYVLAHRDDQEAFYAYVDKLDAEANWVEMPPLESLDSLTDYPEFFQNFYIRGEKIKEEKFKQIVNKVKKIIPRLGRLAITDNNSQSQELEDSIVELTETSDIEILPLPFFEDKDTGNLYILGEKGILELKGGY